MRDKIYFAERRGFIKLALRENIPIVPAISWGSHDTLIVLADIYEVMQQFHKMGMPWLLGVDPLVFPVYLGLPWGLAFGPLPNIPLPVTIYTRVCPPIVFARYGKEAASDRTYVDECYELVRSKMQQELDTLIQQANH
jgi:1-acyl-sn-glycerol-3-phosphate acyltransferase